MSALQQQLAAVAANSSRQLDLQSQRSAHGQSLIWEPAVAVSQNFETIYQHCILGFKELVAGDPSLASFEDPLFTPSSLGYDRLQSTADENRNLNQLIKAVLPLLSPYINSSKGLLALEWLVRRFRIHEYNVEDLVYAFLHFHNEPIFVRMLEILPKSLPKILKFLQPYRNSLISPPFKAILYAAANDTAVFSAFGNYWIWIGRNHDSVHSNVSQFWLSIVMQATLRVVSASRAGNSNIRESKVEAAMLQIIPIVKGALDLGNRPDMVAGGYNLLVILSSGVQLPETVLDDFMTAVASNWTESTTKDRLICLATICKARESPKIPKRVVEPILSANSVPDFLEVISDSLDIRKFAYGLALRLSKLLLVSKTDRELKILCKIFELDLLDKKEIRRVIKPLMEALKDDLESSSADSRALKVFSAVKKSKYHSTVMKLAQKEDIKLDMLDDLVAIDAPEEEFSKMEIEPSENMVTNPSSILDEIKLDGTILDLEPSSSCQAALKIFNNRQMSQIEIQEALTHKALKHSETVKGDSTFISFCLRLAFTNSIPTVRLLAVGKIDDAVVQARSTKPNLDFQVLLPYIICLLGDSMSAIRRLSIKLLNNMISHQETNTVMPEIWGRQSFYPSTSESYWLSRSHADFLVNNILLKDADAFAMDAGAVIQSVKRSWENMTKEYEPLRDFFIRHAIYTGLLKVKATLVSILPRRPRNKKRRKSDGEDLSNSLYLAIKDWLMFEEKLCEDQGVNYKDFLRASLDGIKYLDSPVEPHVRELLDFGLNEKALYVLFEFIHSNWRKLGEDSKTSLVLELIKHALQPEDTISAAKESHQFLIASAIRSLSLGESEVNALLQHTVEIFREAEESEPKRRRTSHHETSKRPVTRNVGDIIRRISFVLEVVESLQLEAKSNYIASLFEILGRLQALGERTDSSLDYVKILCVKSILGVVEKMTYVQKEHWHGDGSLIRSDLLVDIIRETRDRELQNTSLLVISNVAPWVPELTLNSVMPIFTFMGDTILRDEDDYTAHIVNQTISTVVPSLTKSLKKRGRDIVSGTADILISFTAAYDHIPQSRRGDLFGSLVDALGSEKEEFLFAVVVLLMDKHPTEDVTDQFIPKLLQSYGEKTALKALTDIMDLLLDMLRSKRTRSNALLNLNDLSLEQISEKSIQLMEAFNSVLSASQELMRRIGQSLSTNTSDFQDQRREFQNLMRLSIQLCRQHQHKSGMQLASALQRQIFLLLDTEELVEIGKALSGDPDKNVRNSVIEAITRRCRSYGTRASIRRQTVVTVVDFIPTACQIISSSDDYESLSTAISCVHQIVRIFGAKDHSKVLDAANIIAHKCLGIVEVQRVTLHTLSTIFGILKAEALPVLPFIVNSTFELLGKVTAEESPDIHIHDACLGLLDSIAINISLAMSGKILQQTLQLTLASIGAGIESKANVVDKLCQSIAHHARPGDLLPIIEQWYISCPPIERNFSSTMACIQLAIASIQNHRDEISESSKVIFGFIFEALKLRLQQATETDEEFEETEVQAIEQKVIDLLLVAVTRVNNRVLHPFFVKLVGLATSDDDEQEITAAITTCKAMLAVQDKLKSLFTSYMSLALPMIGALLQRDWDISDPNEVTLLPTLLALLTQSFVYDESNYWQSPSNFSVVAGPLVDVLATPTLGKADERHCIEAVATLAKNAASQDHYKTINSQLFQLLRGESPAARAAAVRCERYLTSNLGEEWLALLPEMLPVIAELLEDDDEIVGKETRAWVRAVEEETGESMDSMLQ